MSQGQVQAVVPTPAAPAAATVNDHTSNVTNRQTLTLAGIVALIVGLAEAWNTLNGTATIKAALDEFRADTKPAVVINQPGPVQPAPAQPAPTPAPPTPAAAPLTREDVQKMIQEIKDALKVPVQKVVDAPAPQLSAAEHARIRDEAVARIRAWEKAGKPADWPD